MFIVFIVFLLNNYFSNKYVVLSVAFFLGLLRDYIKFNILGQTSIVLLLLLFVVFLYEKKFKKESHVFRIFSFMVFGLFFQILLKEFNIFQIFWYTILFFLITRAYRFL